MQFRKTSTDYKLDRTRFSFELGEIQITVHLYTWKNMQDFESLDFLFHMYYFTRYRTFLESEVKNPVLLKDLYEKMIKLNLDEPMQSEHEEHAITKLRYMQVE